MPEILHAPKTGGDPIGGWPQVHERIVRYFLRNVAGTPWANHLALILAVLSARRQDVQTVRVTMMNLHARFSDIFETTKLQTMEEWKPDRYLPLYVRGEIVPQDSQYTRQLFLTRYSSATRHVQNWLDALPETERLLYQRFVLPLPSQFLYEQLSKWKEVKQNQEDHRKTETAAVVPHFSALRAEAHFRFNRLQRLRLAYRQALSQVPPDHSNLPLEFSYDEGDPPRERLHFRLWDRKSFVLHPEQVTAYVPSTREKARRGDLPYSDERNDVFLEFVRAESLNGDALPKASGLLTCSSLAYWEQKRAGEREGVAARQTWLRQWGYGDEETHLID